MRMNPGGALGMGGKLIFSNFIEVTYLERKLRGQYEQPCISVATNDVIRNASQSITTQFNSTTNYSLQHEHDIKSTSLLNNKNRAL